MWLRLLRIRSFEVGLRFLDGEFVGLFGPGSHWIWNLQGRQRVEVVSRRDPALVHDQLDLIIKSGVLGDQALVLDLQDFQRALVWVDGRFETILGPGRHVYWTTHRAVRAEVIDASNVRYQRPDAAMLIKLGLAHRFIEFHKIEPGQAGVLFINGDYVATLGPGTHAFWKDLAVVKVQTLDLREATLDVAGQEIITADKVSIRLNALVTYRVVDPRAAVSAVDDARQALYREAQLAVRAVIGTRELDQLLSDKEAVVEELAELVKRRAGQFGVEVLSMGIRDVILPGDMKELFNKVTEARKAAEANLIARREEIAALRSQANSAKLLQENPILLRLRELETLEKVAATGKLRVFLGDKSLTERVLNMV